MGADIQRPTSTAAGHHHPHLTLWLALLVTMAAVACSARPDINDAHNSRDTGHYQVIERQAQDDGTVLLHVLAQQPEHGQEIAEDLVRQNFTFSPTAVRVVVDPAAGGDRQTYRWDAAGLRVDDRTDGLPAPHSAAPTDGAAH